MRLTILLLAAVAAEAQVQKLDLLFDGVNCVPCLESLPNRAKRIRGVDAASIEAEKGILRLTMLPANRVRVEQFRDLIEQDGTKARKAVRIEVHGVLDATGMLLATPQNPLPFRLDKAGQGSATVRVTGFIEELKPAAGEGLKIHVIETTVLR